MGFLQLWCYFSKAQGYCVMMTTVTLYDQKYDGMGFNVCLSMQLFMQMSWKLAKIHEDPDKTGLWKQPMSKQNIPND